MSKRTDAERAEAIATLRKHLKVGDTVHTVLRHVSRSGMMRHISVVITTPEGPWDVTWHVARILGYRQADDGGLKVGGCGMDMGFHVVYGLSSMLWPDGHRCTSRTVRGRHVCQSNDHFNDYALPYDGRKVKHRDGGYALHQAWL